RHEALLLRKKPDYDGAIPSGNSVAALNLLRLADWTGDAAYRMRAEGVFRAYGSILESTPLALPALLAAVDYASDRPKEVVLVWPPGSNGDALLARARGVFLPNRALVATASGTGFDALAQRAPALAGKIPRGSRATAYICEAGRCDLPTSDPDT